MIFLNSCYKKYGFDMFWYYCVCRLKDYIDYNID